ncbi:hypothetical protein Tco_1427630 [Tanacetum coccineum]
MSTSNVHQQSLVDAGSETRSPLLGRCSYIPWASHFRRYLNLKRETRKWLNKEIDDVMMEEIQDVHMFKRKSLRVPMVRMMLETYKELYELRHHELLQMFNATTVVRKDEVGVILTNEQNYFLFADVSGMGEIEELSANICLMARIQPTNIDLEAGPSYNSAFLSEVQTPSTSYVNPLFARDNHMQQYLKQPKIINNTTSDDQIDTNIIFDAPNDDVNSDSVEEDNNVQQSYKLEQLARNAYRKVEK